MPDLPIFDHDRLDSTSDEARRMVLAGTAAPFVVRTKRQTQGRGRGSNSWWSDEGSLLFTVALDPGPLGISPRHESRLALVAALAVIEAAQEVVPGLNAGIRWPNDVEVEGRKLAGILPERIETRQGPRLLIGVGLNVTTEFHEAPAEIQKMATSLHEHGALQRAERLLEIFLARFENNLRALVEDEQAIARRWRGLDLLRGRSVRVRQGDQIIVGVGREIDDEGALVVETEHGLVAAYGGQVIRDPST